MTVGQMRTNAAEVLKDTCLLESAERERRMGFRRYEKPSENPYCRPI